MSIEWNDFASLEAAIPLQGPDDRPWLYVVDDLSLPQSSQLATDRPRPYRHLTFGATRKECISAVNFAFDRREQTLIEVADTFPLRLHLSPSPKLRNYMRGRHGDGDIERLRAWVTSGLAHLVDLLDEKALTTILLMFDPLSLDYDAAKLDMMSELLAELHHKALHAATQGQAAALKVFFEGDVYAAHQPTRRPPRGTPKALRRTSSVRRT